MFHTGPAARIPAESPKSIDRAPGLGDDKSLGKQSSSCRASHIVGGRATGERGPLEQKIYDMTRGGPISPGGATSESEMFVMLLKHFEKIERALLRVAAEPDGLRHGG
jgi:hypothetical protein